MVVLVIGVNVLFWRPLRPGPSGSGSRIPRRPRPAQRRPGPAAPLGAPCPGGPPGAAGRPATGRGHRPFGLAEHPLHGRCCGPDRGRGVRGAVIAVVLSGRATRWSIYTAPRIGRVRLAFGLGAATLARVMVLLDRGQRHLGAGRGSIGMNPRVSRLAQPVVQVLATFPANFLFPCHGGVLHRDRREAELRRHPADGPRLAVVHPVQRDRRRLRHPKLTCARPAADRGARQPALAAI